MLKSQPLCSSTAGALLMLRSQRLVFSSFFPGASLHPLGVNLQSGKVTLNDSDFLFFLISRFAGALLVRSLQRIWPCGRSAGALVVLSLQRVGFCQSASGAFLRRLGWGRNKSSDHFLLSWWRCITTSHNPGMRSYYSCRCGLDMVPFQAAI